MICAYLLYKGYFQTAQEAMNYYAVTRTYNAKVGSSATFFLICAVFLKINHFVIVCLKKSKVHGNTFVKTRAILHEIYSLVLSCFFFKTFEQIIYIP